MKISYLLIKKNNNLDIIRILLALLVIFGHSAILNGESKFWIDPITYFFEYTYSGALAVKMFFFISGMVVTNSYLHKMDAVYFINSRIFRIMPLLFVVLIITVFVFGVILTNLQIKDYFSSLDGFSYIWRNLLFKTRFDLPGVFNDNIFPNTVNGSLWSLKYEVGCYIIVLFSFLILGKKNKNYLNIPILLVILDSFLPEGMFYHYLGNNSEINLTPVSFALGSFFAVNSNKINMNLITVFFTIIVYYIFKDTQKNHIFLIISAATIITYMSSNKSILKMKPKYDISYGVYLWGFIIQQTLFHYLGYIYTGLHCFIAMLFAVILGFLSYVLIEKPFMAFGKKLFGIYKRKVNVIFNKPKYNNS